jgi:drug/metabolite transporter superfamily protein YnfA
MFLVFCNGLTILLVPIPLYVLAYILTDVHTIRTYGISIDVQTVCTYRRTDVDCRFSGRVSRAYYLLYISNVHSMVSRYRINVYDHMGAPSCVLVCVYYPLVCVLPTTRSKRCGDWVCQGLGEA